ncbi:MAG: hypothetical protein WC466_05720 [Candidatus Izemoplasmatales bacterium]
MEKLIAYCLKTKTKEEMINAEIVKTSRGYMAKGETKDGNKMSLVMNEANAVKAIENGLAKKAF